MKSLLMILTRDQVVAFEEKGQLRKGTILFKSVCEALSDGKTHNQIAEMFNLVDDAHVRAIQRKHCPECR